MPFFFPNGSEYKLILLDTNVLSNIAKNKHNEFKNFLIKFVQNKYAPCFSFQSIIELRKSTLTGITDLYESFIKIFSVIPCLMLFPYRCVTNQEINLYNNENDKNYVDLSKAMNAFTPLGKDDTYDFKIWLEKIIGNLGILIDSEDKENISCANDWVNEKIAFQKKYNFVTYPKFEENFFETFFYYEQPLLLGKNYNTNDFPAIKMMSITKYDRLFRVKKKVGVNDVNDVFISAYTPYMDAIITEKHQAEVLKQSVSKLRCLEKVERYTLGDLIE